MTPLILRPSFFTEADCDELNELLEAKLRAHLAAKRLYGKVMVKDSATGTNPPATVKDAGSPSVAKPALSTRREAIVAWDLTLRCPVCNSAVEGNVRKYHCFTCERRSR